MFGQLTFNVPLSIQQQKGNIDIISIYLPQYNSQNCPNYDKEFDSPQFGQKDVHLLKIMIDSDVEPRQQQIDWQLAVLNHFQFTKVYMKPIYFNQHLFVLSEIQPNVEEFEIILKNCYDYNNVAEFFLNQKKYVKLRNLELQSLLYPIQPNLWKAYSTFVANNLNNLENLRLTIEIQTMLMLFKEFRNLQNEQQVTSSTKLNELSLNFVNMGRFEDQERAKIQLEGNVDYFIRTLKQFKILRICLPFLDNKWQMYQTVYSAVGYEQNQQNIQELLICISRCRVPIDLLLLFEQIKYLVNLKILQLNFNFCTKLTFSQPKEIISLPSLEILKLNLTYQKCSFQVLQFIQCTNLTKLNVNLSYIQNIEIMRQNYFELINIINHNERLSKLNINMAQSSDVEKNIKEQFINSIKRKVKQIVKLKLFMTDQSILEQLHLASIFNIEILSLNFLDHPIIDIHKDLLRIGSVLQNNRYYDYSKISEILHYAGLRIAGKIRSVSIYQITARPQTNELLSNEYDPILKFISCANYLTTISIQFKQQPPSYGQMVEETINILNDFPYILKLEISCQYFTNRYLKIESSSRSKIIQIISARFQIRRFTFFLSDMGELNQILNSRYKEFNRLIKSFKKLLNSNLLQTFRRDIIFQIMDYAFENQNQQQPPNVLLAKE